MPIRHAYALPEGSKVALSMDDRFIDGSHNVDGSLTLETAAGFTVSGGSIDGTNSWANRIIAHHFVEETPEEQAARLAKMTVGQRLAAVIDTASEPGQVERYMKGIVIKRARSLAESVPHITSLNGLVINIMLSDPPFQTRFLSEEEIVSLDAIVERIRTDLNNQPTPQSANQRLINAVTKFGGEEPIL
jgi:hypothetical protein